MNLRYAMTIGAVAIACMTVGCNKDATQSASGQSSSPKADPKARPVVQPPQVQTRRIADGAAHISASVLEKGLLDKKKAGYQAQVRTKVERIIGYGSGSAIVEEGQELELWLSEDLYGKLEAALVDTVSLEVFYNSRTQRWELKGVL